MTQSWKKNCYYTKTDYSVGIWDRVLEITEYEDHVNAAIKANTYPHIYWTSKLKLPSFESKRKAPAKPSNVPKIWYHLSFSFGNNAEKTTISKGHK